MVLFWYWYEKSVFQVTSAPDKGFGQAMRRRACATSHYGYGLELMTGVGGKGRVLSGGT